MTATHTPTQEQLDRICHECGDSLENGHMHSRDQSTIRYEQALADAQENSDEE